MTEIHGHNVSEVKSPKSRCWQGHAPSEIFMGILPWLLLDAGVFLAVFGVQSLHYRYIVPILSSYGLFPVLTWLHLYKHTGHTGFGPTLFQHDLIWTNYIANNYFQISHPEVLVLGFQHTFLRGAGGGQGMRFQLLQPFLNQDLVFLLMICTTVPLLDIRSFSCLIYKYLLYGLSFHSLDNVL